MTLVNGTTIDPQCYYRIQNVFEHCGNAFWYELNFDQTELNSCCKDEKKAEVYRGDAIIEYADVIKRNKTAKLIKV